MNLPILMYHKVLPKADPGNDLAVSADAFGRQMEWLKLRGFQTLTLAELARRVAAGEPVAGRRVVVTFDDAYAGVAEHAGPRLKSLGFGATVFAVSRCLGKTNEWDAGRNLSQTPCLDANGLRALRAAGWEIGSHGATHANLTGLSPERLAEEVEASRKELEQQVGAPVNTFSYPYGSWDAHAREAVRRAGYVCACAISPKTASVTADLWALRRVYVKPTDSPADFRRKLSGWYLRFRAWRKR